MKLVISGALLLVVIHGCQRVCGEMEPLVVLPPLGGMGPGGEGGAAEAGAGAPPLGGSPAGGMPSDGGGPAGSDSGGAGASACLTAPSASITDFEPASSLPALGSMKSDDGSPNGGVESDATGTRYVERGSLPEVGSPGFTFTFNACFNIGSYQGIRFEVSGTTPAGVNVSILPVSASEPDKVTSFARDGDSTTVCVPFVADQTTVEMLQFKYIEPNTGPRTVALDLDDLAFYGSEPCPGT